MTGIDPNNPEIKPGDSIGGYTVQRIVALEAIRSVFYELIHTVTGAKHIHISKDDRENTFSVAFKTVPSDSTGVAHILEHTVLCGSRKYPVRDPFFSMLKRSLATFMNAFTASDWTMYPFSTQNRKDFYNLMDVYLDAVFFPRLDRLNFKQEGHRLELDADSGQLVYKGVVYNEMKGAMSSADQVMARSLLNALYPDTTYRFNSGGEPADIPKLTHEQLIAFHRQYYHPSNAFFYTYGNIPLADHLAFIEAKVLTSVTGIDPKSEVGSQPRWPEAKIATYAYPLDRQQDPKKKYQACVAWLTADIQDTFEVLVLTLLEHILLGNAASPLRKALIDSQLGSSLSDGTGFVADSRDTMFACGLKDIGSEDAEAVETIVFDTLGQLVDRGIDAELIESAIHQIEFHRKEVTNSPYPYGIKLMLFFSGSWFHGGDPVRSFRLDEDLARIRREMAAGSFFENRIRTWFLENTHRVRFTLSPDPELADSQARREDAELAQIKSRLKASDIQAIQADALALKQLQETTEDVRVLPTLSIADIPPAVEKITPTPFPDIKATCYRQPTGGIFYLAAALGAGELPGHEVALMPFFCHVFSRIGTKRRDYAEMARRIDACTGGISLDTQARTRFDTKGACIPLIALSAKALERNQAKMFDIVQELLFEYDVFDLQRLKSLLLEYQAGLESMIVHNGHRLAISLASRHFSPACWLSETWHGVHQLAAIKDLTRDLDDQRLFSLAKDLSHIGNVLFSADSLKLALIGDAPQIDAARPFVEMLRKDMPPGGHNPFVLPEPNRSQSLPREGWSTSSAVSFVASSFATVRMGHEDAPVLAVIAKMLRSLYLHREIREKGGAYGGFALYSSETGLFSFGSYRDPHIVSTLNVYRGALGFIDSGQFTEEDIKEAILQVCSEIDKPDPPGPAAKKAFFRQVVSLSDEARDDFKKQLLSMTRDRVVAAAKKYFDQRNQNQGIAVISGEAQLKAANEKLADRPLALRKI
jgi:Zn-dependent M16 (insulinase) family peptidase